MPIAVDERRLCFPDLKHARGRRIHGNAPSTDLASDVGEDVSRDIKLIDGKGPRQPRRPKRTIAGGHTNMSGMATLSRINAQPDLHGGVGSGSSRKGSLNL